MSFLQSDDESGSDDDKNWKRKPKKKFEAKSPTLSFYTEEKEKIIEEVQHVSILMGFKFSLRDDE